MASAVAAASESRPCRCLPFEDSAAAQDTLETRKEALKRVIMTHASSLMMRWRWR